MRPAADRPRRGRARAGRDGFTLIELLVVIVIIGILVGLLVPVIAGAVRKAKEGANTAEINQMANALAAFKERYGDYPPSRVVLMENGYYDTTSSAALSGITWLSSTSYVNGQPDIAESYIDGSGNIARVFSSTDVTYGQLCQRSLRYLRKFWPRSQFSSSAVIYTTTSGWHDFNGNGSLESAPILLEGPECLAFFLGGIPNAYNAGGPYSMTGFAKNPVNPFRNDVATGSREPSFYEFKSDRLIDDDGDGIPGYCDTLGQQSEMRYYAYFSSYGNGGYDPNDCNFTETALGGSTPIQRIFRVNFGVGAWFDGVTNVVVSPSPNPYTSSLPVPDYNSGAPGTQPAVYQNKQTYQIISAGADHEYGLGGAYDPQSNAARLPLEPQPSGGALSGVASPWDIGLRVREADNLSNFTTGRLE